MRDIAGDVLQVVSPRSTDHDEVVQDGIVQISLVARVGMESASRALWGICSKEQRRPDFIIDF